jgi:hypothetical protein
MWDGLVLRVVLIILAVTTILTSIQRIVWVYRHAAGVPLESPDSSAVASPNPIRTEKSK